MEEKLFWIGILVGIHLFLSYLFKEKGKFRSTALVHVWHAFFIAIVAFVAILLLTVTLDNRRGEVVTAVLFSKKQVIYGLIAGVIGWFWGYFRIKSLKTAKTGAEHPSIKEDMEWSETIFSAVILASVVMYLFVQAFKIPSGSMRMTFLEGDHLFVNKFIYGFRIPFTDKKILRFTKPRREDIVVFQFPSNSPDDVQCGGRQYGKDFIKRVVGEPGDVVRIKSGVVSVNGKELKEDRVQFADPSRYPASPEKIPPGDYQKFWEQRMLGKMFADYVRDDFGPVTVPQGYYLVMGDNRDRSCDSRYWGPVPEYLIKGSAWFIYWPPSRISSPD